MPRGGPAPSEVVVRGSIRFDEPPEAFAGATVRVRLEDCTEADGHSTVLAEATFRDVTVTPDVVELLRFQLPARVRLGAVRHEIHVHVDRSGDGSIAPEDYVNVVSCPVLPPDGPLDVIVPISRVEKRPQGLRGGPP